MRNLSSTLLSAQKSEARLPYVKVEVGGKVAGVTRLDWSRLYSGSESDFYHAATMPADGSLIRTRVDPTSNQLYRQRVANPGPGSDFSTWTSVGLVSSASGIALSSQQNTVQLFYVQNDQRTIVVRESTDYGATFGGPTSIVNASATVGWLAADLNGSGDLLLLYSVGGGVYAIKRTNGTWGSPTSWTNSLDSVTGLACVYRGDWNVVVSGKDSANEYKVGTCLYGDGYSKSPGVWSSLEELTVASAGSSVEFHCPCVGFPDVFRAFFLEKYTGTQSYSRPFWSHSLGTTDFINNLWREPIPFDLSSSYGLAMAYSTAYLWLSTPSGVWRGAISPPPVDLSEDVLSLVSEAEPGLGKVRIELRNDDGRYNDLSAGNYAVIKEGSEVEVSPGYYTTAGAEVSGGLAYWIEGWEYVSRGGQALFVLHARDGWGLLGHWKARRQFAWDPGAKNIFQLLLFIFARAGLEFSAFSMSSTMSDLYPAFTIHPGESGATAVRRLLAMVPDVLFFQGDCGYIKNPLASDASDYSYGTDHPLVEGRYASLCPEVNRVQVFGDGVLAEAFAWSKISGVYDRLFQVHDLDLGTVSEAQDRADAELRRQEIAAEEGEVTVPTNCGQELYDVIDIADPRAGLTATKRRVLGLTLRYSTGREARYDQRILLGGV